MENIHVLGNKVTNFENPDVEEILESGFVPVYENGKIVDWK
jgi:hypothetical protein